MRKGVAILLLGFLAACGGRDTPTKSGHTVDIATPAAMPMCEAAPGESITVFTDGYNGCHSPNGGLYHGMLCFSGEAWACDRMHLFISPISLIKDPINVNASHGGSGSRDELIGHLFYLIRTHNKPYANALLTMIQRNNNRVCTDDQDNRCYVTPAMFGLMRVVWKHLDLTPSSNMVVGNVGDDHTILASASSAPVGYQLHLVMLTLLIRMHTNTWSSTLDDALHTAYKRMPDNLFFRWMVGQDVSAALNAAIATPHAEPTRDWPWARPTTGPNDHTGGYVFLGNLVMKK